MYRDSCLVNKHEKINYVEFPAKDIEATKAFGWSFVDYGSDYTAFSDEDLDGGFFRANLASSAKNGSALIIFYSNNLSQTQTKVEEAAGTLLQPIYEFPGGRRFHFADPSDNEFAVWSDTE